MPSQLLVSLQTVEGADVSAPTNVRLSFPSRRKDSSSFIPVAVAIVATIVTDGADAAAAAADDETVDSAGEAHSVLVSLSSRQLTSVRASIF